MVGQKGENRKLSKTNNSNGKTRTQKKTNRNRVQLIKSNGEVRNLTNIKEGDKKSSPNNKGDIRNLSLKNNGDNRVSGIPSTKDTGDERNWPLKKVNARKPITECTVED